MENSNLVILCANVFIELNKTKEVRKIYFEDLLKLNEILDEYVNNLNVFEFKKLEYENNLFFYFYEDYDGYIIKLANGINIDNLQNYFNRDTFKDEKLLCALSEIDMEEIFTKKSKQIKVKL